VCVCVVSVVFFQRSRNLCFYFSRNLFFIFLKRFGQLIVGQFLPSQCVCERSFHLSPGAFPGWWVVIGFTCLAVVVMGGGRVGWSFLVCSVRLLWKR
jgi:hypothetical protein